MKNSWKLGRIAGIDIFLHPTFLLVILWVVVLSWVQGTGLFGTVRGVLGILILFALVILHELGHSLTARRFGIRTKDITLLPIGGVSSLERLPEKAGQQLLVSLAGPMVNILIAFLTGLILFIRSGWEALTPIQTTHLWQGPILQMLFWMNVSLAVFNLLPAFPMDGGRVFRAILAFFMKPVLATKVAARVGQGMALLFGIFGLLGNPILFFIAIFIWLGAAQESDLASLQSLLQNVPVYQVMSVEFHTLSKEDTLDRAVAYVLSGFQYDFPVVSKGQLIGVLSHHALLQHLARDGVHSKVEAAMQTQFQAFERTETLDKVLLVLKQGLGRSIPVVDGSCVVGLLTFEKVAEFLSIQAALSSKPENLTQ